MKTFKSPGRILNLLGTQESSPPDRLLGFGNIFVFCSQRNHNKRYLEISTATMEFSIVSIGKLFACGLLFMSARAQIEEASVIDMNINEETWSLPLLPNLQTRHSFPMKDINQAEFEIDPDYDAACIFWSDKDFAWAGFERHSDWESTFPNANRLFCYDQSENYIPMMIEDMSGNRMLIRLYWNENFYAIAKLKMPLNVRRAISLTGNMLCEFRSRESFSAKFKDDLISEPFRGAIEVYCSDR